MSRIEALTLERDDADRIALRAWRDRDVAAAAPEFSPIEPGSLGPGCIWFVGLRAERAPAGRLPLAADAVLCDPGLERKAGELLPGCYRETVAADPEAASDRLRKLAGEGWRVVRLVAGDPATLPRAAAELGLLAGSGLRVSTYGRGHGVVAAMVAFAGPAPAPQHLTTGCNGLAG